MHASRLSRPPIVLRRKLPQQVAPECISEVTGIHPDARSARTPHLSPAARESAVRLLHRSKATIKVISEWKDALLTSLFMEVVQLLQGSAGGVDS